MPVLLRVSVRWVGDGAAGNGDAEHSFTVRNPATGETVATVNGFSLHSIEEVKMGLPSSALTTEYELNCHACFMLWVFSLLPVVTQCLSRAHRAQQEWQDRPAPERADLLRAWARKLIEHTGPSKLLRAGGSCMRLTSLHISTTLKTTWPSS